MGARLLSTVTLHITRVTASQTRTPGVKAYLIDGLTAEDRILQLQTIDAWRASLCDRARQTHQVVTLQYEDTRFGKTIRQITLNQPVDWSAA